MEYKGPTSGRITVTAGGVVERVSFNDIPLTADETRAVAWFTKLSPIEQLREVRRLKWNLDRATADRDAFERIVREQDAEISKLSGRLARIVPDGYAVPVSAADLLACATAHGWLSDHTWEVHKGSEDGADPGYAVFRIMVGNGDRAFKRSWSVDPGGTGRMIGRGLAREKTGPWRDAPSLRKIREIIERS